MLRQIEPAKCRGKLNPSMWDDDNEWVAEFKYDGTRYLMHIGPEGSRFTSRRISVNGGLYVEKRNFPHLEDITNPTEIVLDGEFILKLYGSSYDSTQITGSSRSVAIEKQKQLGYLYYMVFDILYLNGISIQHQSLEYRKKVLKSLVSDIGSPYIIYSKHYHSDKYALYEKIVKQGGEGVVLKHIHSQYGERSKWVKVKKKDTWDVVITGYLKPSESSEKVDGTISVTRYKDKGWIGAICMGMYDKDGKSVDVGSVSGMDESVRAQISCYPKDYLGKVIEVEAQERLKSGRFRHPRFIRFRPDKRKEECLYAE